MKIQMFVVEVFEHAVKKVDQFDDNTFGDARVRDIFSCERRAQPGTAEIEAEKIKDGAPVGNGVAVAVRDDVDIRIEAPDARENIFISAPRDGRKNIPGEISP